MGIEPFALDKAPAAKDFTSKMEGTLESMRKNLEKAKKWMKLNANKHHSVVLTYKIGQHVWLASENLQLTHTSCKLSETWLVPYKIISLAGPNAMKLQLLRSLQIHLVVNVSWVKPYHECMEGQTSYWPRPVHMIEDRNNEWEVDYIVDSHLKKKKLKYLIHLKDYDNSDSTWKPKSNLGNAKDAIHDFHKSHFSAPHALSIDPADFLLLFQNWLELFTEVHLHYLPFDCLEVNL